MRDISTGPVHVAIRGKQIVLAAGHVRLAFSFTLHTYKQDLFSMQ